MDENEVPSLPVPEKSPESEATSSPANPPNQQKVPVGMIVGIVLALALLISFIVFLFATPDVTVVTRIRDVFIIFLALESLLIGFVLVILIIQIARLTNFLQNEVKPILDSTNETVSTLRGTSEFLSNNLAEPVIKINEYVAALKQLVSLFGLGRK